LFYGPLFDEQVSYYDAASSKKVLGKFKPSGTKVTIIKSGTKLGIMAENYLHGGQYTIIATLSPV
jgi:hypothetical protein